MEIKGTFDKRKIKIIGLLHDLNFFGEKEDWDEQDKVIKKIKKIKSIRFSQTKCERPKENPDDDYDYDYYAQYDPTFVREDDKTFRITSGSGKSNWYFNENGNFTVQGYRRAIVEGNSFIRFSILKNKREIKKIFFGMEITISTRDGFAEANFDFVGEIEKVTSSTPNDLLLYFLSHCYVEHNRQERMIIYFELQKKGFDIFDEQSNYLGLISFNDGIYYLQNYNLMYSNEVYFFELNGEKMIIEGINPLYKDNNKLSLFTEHKLFKGVYHSFSFEETFPKQDLRYEKKKTLASN